MNPTTLQELITLLTQIVIEHGGDTLVEFQDYDEDEREIQIVVETKTDYTDSGNNNKKLCIRIV